MARRRSSGVRVIRERAPIIRVSSSPVVPLKYRRAMRRHGRAYMKGGTSIVDGIISGAAMGLVEKSGIAIPVIGPLGKSGSAALIAYGIGKFMHIPLASRLAVGFASMAAYQMMVKGSIDGIDMMPEE